MPRTRSAARSGCAPTTPSPCSRRAGSRSFAASPTQGSRAIAAAMYLSLSTVKTHVAHLYDKLGVHDRAAAVTAADRRGLLE